MCRRLADAPAVEEIAPDTRWDLALRVLSALHHLALTTGVDPWDDPAATVTAHGERIARFVATQGVQTNEVQRSWLLLPCFLEVARRAGADTLDLVELGPSAGLNLVWDRYRYRYERGGWGDPSGPLALAGEERRPVPGPVLDTRPLVRGRVGIDRNPIDVTGDDGATLLRSFVWADQHERLERLDRAIAALRLSPPELVRGEIQEALPGVLAGRRDGALTIVFETAVLAYLPEAARHEVHETLDRAAADGPLALVRASRPPDGSRDHFGLWIRLWPGEREAVALGHFHGAWLEWLG